MKVAVITSSSLGTASHHLPVLMASERFDICQVILVEGVAGSPKGRLTRKLKKALRIGPLGALMGMRMREWYRNDVRSILPIEDLRTCCERHLVPFATTPSIGNQRTVELLSASQADIAVSLGNGYIPSQVFLAPRLGMLNIHHELLPERQNAQSVVWSIHDGSPVTGYTIHRIDAGIDTGAILLREEVRIRFKQRLRDTVSHTMADLLEASAQGLRRVLDDLPRYMENACPQGPGRKRTTPTFSEFVHILRNHHVLKAKQMH